MALPPDTIKRVSKVIDAKPEKVVYSPETSKDIVYRYFYTVETTRGTFVEGEVDLPSQIKARRDFHMIDSRVFCNTRDRVARYICVSWLGTFEI